MSSAPAVRICAFQSTNAVTGIGDRTLELRGFIRPDLLSPSYPGIAWRHSPSLEANAVPDTAVPRLPRRTDRPSTAVAKALKSGNQGCGSAFDAKRRSSAHSRRSRCPSTSSPIEYCARPIERPPRRGSAAMLQRKAFPEDQRRSDCVRSEARASSAYRGGTSRPGLVAAGRADSDGCRSRRPLIRAPSNAHSNSSSSGSSKSSGTTKRPSSIPNTGRSSWTGTRRTTGRPERVMTTSSPATARRSSRERWVFASWTLT